MHPEKTSDGLLALTRPTLWSRQFRHTMLIASACTLTGCVVDPNAWPTSPPPQDTRVEVPPQQAPQPVRSLVKRITYSGGQVSYFRTSNSPEVAQSNMVRICLENNTGQPKSMRWTRNPSNVGDLVTRSNGARSCADIHRSHRVEWGFYDRGGLKKSEGMNLSSFGGQLVEFIWVRDY